MTSTDAADARRRRRERHHEADVVVVGAGVLGCALAHALASQGRSVLLLERWLREPDRIVGELMQPGGVQSLQRLGLADCLEGIDAVPCYGYHVSYGGRSVAIPYPAVGADGRIAADALATQGGGAGADHHPAAKIAGAPEGRSFHHGRFIAQLRRRCQAHANITVVEAEVTGLVRGDQDDEILGVETRSAPDAQTGARAPGCFFGQLTVVADGYGSRFRAEVLGSSPVVRSKFYALELRDCPLAAPHFGHVLIQPGGYPVLLYQIGPRETRALIDVPLGLPAAAPAAGGVRGYIRHAVLPALPPAVRPAVAAALLAEDRIPRSMPNSWLPPPPRAALVRAARRGVVLLGDAYNMRHPLTGGGMTVALHDAELLAGLLRPDRVPRLGDRAAVAAALGRFHWTRKRLTAIINVLAQALYTLFAADSHAERVLQEGCFAAFERGWAAQPVGLMSGVLHQPLLLAYHFFRVAFLAVWLNGAAIVRGSSSGPVSPLRLLLRLPLALADAVVVLWTACLVFLPVFWRELR